jgi:hypothetical protein
MMNMCLMINEFGVMVPFSIVDLLLCMLVLLVLFCVFLFCVRCVYVWWYS